MNKNKEFLDQIQALRIQNPGADILFLVDSQEMSDDSFTGQEIKSVDIDEMYNNDGEMIIGEDEILDHICEGGTFGEEFAKELGVDITHITVGQWVAKGKDQLNKYRADGTIKNTIIVKTGA